LLCWVFSRQRLKNYLPGLAPKYNLADLYLLSNVGLQRKPPASGCPWYLGDRISIHSLGMYTDSFVSPS
jgi:hypothetical protein